MKHKDLRPWLSVIAGGESLVSHAGGVLLVETARRSGLAGQLSRLLGPWRRPMAVHDPGKIGVVAVVGSAAAQALRQAHHAGEQAAQHAGGAVTAAAR